MEVVEVPCPSEPVLVEMDSIVSPYSVAVGELEEAMPYNSKALSMSSSKGVMAIKVAAKGHKN